MPSLPDFKVSPSVQPKPRTTATTSTRRFASVMGLHAVIPSDAFTAETLGTERAGNGVLIRENGVVLTIGYLITEAETIWLHLNDGRVVPGHVLGYDQATGSGWCRRSRSSTCRPLPLGDSTMIPLDEKVVDRGRGRPASARSRRAWSASRNSPAIGNTCSTRRSSPRRRIRTGAAPR
jgi:S1-C subfamily serine protease